MITVHKSLYKIKKLIRAYLELDAGFSIHKHLDLITIAQNPKVYISRRSLKHFVERRKGEMEGKYEETVIIQKMYDTVEFVEKVIQKPDTITNIEAVKCIYEKQVPGANYSVRVVIRKL